MEAVLERPRVSAHGNIFDRAKKFFTNIFKRRKTKSKVAVNSNTVENTGARVIPVEDVMSLLSSIYPLESLVEMYEQRVLDANKRIEELRVNMENNPENQEAIQKEYYELVRNLKVDSYILETKKAELEKMQAEAKKQAEKEEITTKEKNKQSEKNDNSNYTELYNQIKKLFEEKVRLSNARINRVNNINSYLENINSNTNDFQGKLMYLIRFNEAFSANAKEETLIDDQLNVLIKEIYTFNPNLNLNEEFGDIIKQIATPTDDFIRTNVTTILEKQYLLGQEMSKVKPVDQEVLKDILKELDTTLSNLNYNLNNPNMLSNIINEVNKQISAKYSNSKEEQKNDVEKNDEVNLTTYQEQLSLIENTIEEKIKLSSGRLNRLLDINNYIGTINADTYDFQNKLLHIIQFNEDFKTNANKETNVDDRLNGLIANAKFLNSNFNFNEEFGSLLGKISFPTENLIRTIVTTILEKQYLLGQEMPKFKPVAQEVLKDILIELDTVLSNLSYKLPNPEMLSSIIKEVNEQMAVKDLNQKEKTQTEQVEKAQKETLNPDKDVAKPIINQNEGAQKEKERTDRLLSDLKKQYNKINSINDIVSNPLNMTYDASIYFEEIASKAHKKINQIKATLETMGYESSDEIKDLEVFPGNLQDFLNLHKEKIIKASDELISLKSLSNEDEKTLKRIITLQKYLDAEKELVERRLIIEKRRDNTINILGYLSQINDRVSLPKGEPVQEQPTSTQLNQARIEKTKIYVTKTQRITQIKALIETLPVYKVEQCKKSIKIRINEQARAELRKLLGEIKIIINNNNGLNGVRVTTTENKEGYEIQEISNLHKLDDLKVVVSTNGHEVETEEIVKNGRSL